MDNENKARLYSPLMLAYIGDAVFELFVRDSIVKMGNIPVRDAHRRVSSIVCAASQSTAVGKLLDALSEEEKDIYKRGRNAKSYSKPKNAKACDYNASTGLEALVGYLYLQGKKTRCKEIMAMIVAYERDEVSDED